MPAQVALPFPLFRATKRLLHDAVLALAPWILVVVVAGAPSGVLAQSTLPAKVQADILNAAVIEGLKAQDYAAVLTAITQYRALEKQGVEVPVPLFFYEAKAAAAMGDATRARMALEAYLKRATSTDRNYSEAVRWYPTLSASAEDAKVAACSAGSPRSEVLQVREGVVRQCGSQLEWSLANATRVSLNAATNACARLGQGWALPSVQEVRSLSHADEAKAFQCNERWRCYITPLLAVKEVDVWTDERMLSSQPVSVSLHCPNTCGPSFGSLSSSAQALCVFRPPDAAAARIAELAAKDQERQTARESFDSRFVDVDADSLRDTTTGLVWARKSQRMVWAKEAKQTCGSKGAGWRLPTVNELLALYDTQKRIAVPCGVTQCFVSSKFQLDDMSFLSSECSGGFLTSTECVNVDLAHNRRGVSAGIGATLCVR